MLSADRPDDAFAGWTEALRGPDRLRNDDVTLISLELGSVPKEQPQ